MQRKSLFGAFDNLPPCEFCGRVVLAGACCQAALDAVKPIDKFADDHAFLSNFWPSEVTLDGLQYPSVEHAYQAAKTNDAQERKKIRSLNKASQAKSAGKKVMLRPDWERVKLKVMEELVTEKFTKHPELRKLLLETGNHELVEGNHWGDTFWGVCKGKGHNHLGKILMKVRAKIREESHAE